MSKSHAVNAGRWLALVILILSGLGAVLWREQALLAKLKVQESEHQNLLGQLASGRAEVQSLLELLAHERAPSSERAPVMPEEEAASAPDSKAATDFHWSEISTSLRTEIESLSGRIEKLSALEHDEAKVFRRIEEAAEPSIFLVHAEYSYDLRTRRGTWERKVETMWGTAFALTHDGHLITNKHVVQPWKFDAELQVLVARGQARIHADDLQITVWPAGVSTLDERGEILRSTGFSSATGALSLVALASDSIERRISSSVNETAVNYEVHALDDHDLAVLKLDEKVTNRNLRPLRASTEANVRKLDRVLIVGYPRGQRGLDRGFVEASASLGVVRKAHRTIEVSAPMIAGNSGGPLIAEDGTVIGVATRIYSETLGICIRIDRAVELLDEARRAEAIYANEPPPPRSGRGRATLGQ